MPEISEQIGPYVIAREIGRGGMAVVYLANDTKLDRQVAIKVLPKQFTDDAQRLARFEREAKLLASLNHVNIAGVYGLEQIGNTRYLILEFVDGETLESRLAHRRPAVDEALSFAGQIAAAVEAAHERGVVHRDLKPANVMITPDGDVKILDFGLAKPIVLESPSGDLSHTPTLTASPTQRGVILGTAGYMSPEQARGRPVDKRTDVWSFGCLLYEMLSGRKPFAGETFTEAIAATIHQEPDWTVLHADTPPTVHLLLRRCLQKDRKRRLQDIGDARVEIEEAIADPTGASLSGILALPTKERRSPRTIPLAVSLLILLLAISAVGHLMTLLFRGATASPGVGRFVIPVPETARLSRSPQPSLALSPDGSRLVYVARHGDSTQLYLRPMDQPEPEPIPGTRGARAPFFSPDGQWVGFFANRRLKKVSLRDGVTLTLCEVSAFSRGGSWGADGTILLAPDSVSGLWRVSAEGGGLEGVTTAAGLASTEISHRWPDILRGGDVVLYTIWKPGGVANTQIAALDVRTGDRTILLDGAMFARYAPSGHLLFVKDETLLVAPFDPVRMALTGPTVPLVDGLAIVANGGAQFAVSDSGSLVYALGSEYRSGTLVRVDRSGAAESLDVTRSFYSRLALSPDGKRLAVTIWSDSESDVWILDIARGTLSRLTFEGYNTSPVWSPDGKRIVFSSNRVGQFSLFLTDADGGGVPEPLLVKPYGQFANAWSRDGRSIVFVEDNPETGFDIWTVSVDGDRTARPLLTSPYLELNPRLSPDGDWLAYQTDESGRYEVYLRRFPGPGGKRQISPGGGTYPVWAPEGGELFYREGDKLHSIAIETAPVLSVGQPQMVFEADYWDVYDVAPKGAGFVMIRAAEQERGTTRIHVALNWLQEIERRAAADAAE